MKEKRFLCGTFLLLSCSLCIATQARSDDQLPSAVSRHLATSPIRVKPYTGGYPRATRDETCVDPRNDHKVQIDLPWPDAGYIVVDLPEAIFWQRELLYLGHKHITTIWEKQGVVLEEVPFRPEKNGRVSFARTLPNNVRFGASARPGHGYVEMELWLENGLDVELTGLRTQICVLLMKAAGFNELTSENKFFYVEGKGFVPAPVARNEPVRPDGGYGLSFGRSRPQVDEPITAVRSSDGRRWIVTVWDHCLSLPNNPRCPCMHSDPQFPDLGPGERSEVHGRLYFVEGKDLGAFYADVVKYGTAFWKHPKVEAGGTKRPGE